MTAGQYLGPQVIALATVTRRPGQHLRLAARRRDPLQPGRWRRGGEDDRAVRAPRGATTGAIDAAHVDRAPAGDRHLLEPRPAAARLEEANPLAVRRGEGRLGPARRRECHRLQPVERPHEQLHAIARAALVDDVAPVRREREVARLRIDIERGRRRGGNGEPRHRADLRGRSRP